MFLLLMSFWMFSFTTSSSPSYIISTTFPPCFMLHALRLRHPFLFIIWIWWTVPTRCIATHSSFCWILFFFGIFFFGSGNLKDALDIIIPSSVGRPPFLFLFILIFIFPLSTTYLLPVHGSVHLPPPRGPLLFFFFTVTYLTIHYLLSISFLFFCYFLIKFQKKNSDFLSLFFPTPFAR